MSDEHADEYRAWVRGTLYPHIWAQWEEVRVGLAGAGVVAKRFVVLIPHGAWSLRPGRPFPVHSKGDGVQEWVEYMDSSCIDDDRLRAVEEGWWEPRLCAVYPFERKLVLLP